MEVATIPGRNVTRSLILGLCIAASFSATRERRASFCNGPESPLSPSRDLYCIELVRAVGVRQGVGRVELGRAAGPFTVDASADGHLRYTPAVTLSRLPPPARSVVTRRSSRGSRRPP